MTADDLLRTLASLLPAGTGIVTHGRTRATVAYGDEDWTLELATGHWRLVTPAGIFIGISPARCIAARTAHLARRA
jgi:hypothetical protein